jgi:hypothetical protein
MDINAAHVDEYLQNLSDWQQANLALFRELVRKASPIVTEEIKWGVPVFLINNKMIFSMASFKAHTKYNFIHNGALLDDKTGLFNNGLESKKSRSIDLYEGQAVDSAALTALIMQAIEKL